MGIKISETAMAGEDSGAMARITDDGKWEVSWLPRPVDRNSAITAMVLSEALAAEPEASSDRWVFIDGWSEELRLTRNQVLALFSSRYTHSGECIYCPHGPSCITCSPGLVTGPVCTSCAQEIQRREIAADPYFSGNYLAMFGDDE